MLKTNQYCIKSEIYNNHYNISDKIDIDNGVDNKVVWADGLLSTNTNRTKNDICNNHCNMSYIVDKKIPFIEEIQSNHSKPYCFRSKCHSNNVVDNNRNIGNRLNTTKL